MRWILLFCESTVLRPRKEAMTITHHARGELLGKALIMFVGLLLVSLLIIFAIEPSIYTTTLWPGWVPAERYPWPVLLFLGALIAFLSMLMYGVLHHWRWLFWLILIAFTGSVIQIPVEGLQLLGVFPNPYPVWYSLFRGGAGFIELGFAFWMIQTYRHQGVWAMGRKKAEQVSHLARTKLGLIEYRSVGQGPAVLVLNGGHTNCHSPLGHEAFFLAQGYQLIVPSRPGYGRTPSSTGKSAEAFADALVSLLDLLQLDQVIVEGMVWAAFRRFGRVAPQAALKSLMWGLTCLPIDQVLSAMSPDQQQAALAFLQASRSGSGFLHDIHHQCGDLGRVRAPVLVITSKYDGLVSASHAVYVEKHIPQAQLFISEAESHLMWFSIHNHEIQARMQVFLHS